MGDLSGRGALVTGGASGIGRAITLELVKRKCRVVYHVFRSDAAGLRRDLAALGASADCVRGDLTNEDDVIRIVKEAVGFLGRLDVLVNNAGDLIARRSVEDVDLAFFRSAMSVNMESALLVTRAALPYLAAADRGASIVNIASLAGRKGGHPGSLAYSTAKGALLTFTRSLATECAASGIRVNAVAPGLILGTSFHRTHTTEASARDTVRNHIPLGRAGSPADVARAVAFLASEHDGFITGATLDVNGGQYLS